MLTTTEKPKDWLRSADVKAILNCSDATLKNYRDVGRLKYSKVEGTYFYQRSHVEAMLESSAGDNRN